MRSAATTRWATASRPATPGSRRVNPAIPAAARADRKNLKTLLSEALNEPVIVTENGRRRKITKREAIVRQVVDCSATPDLRAVRIVFDLLRDIEGQSEPASHEPSAFTAADEQVIEQLKARLLRKKGEFDE